MKRETKHPEYQYLDTVSDILENGSGKCDFATGTGLKSDFGHLMKYDLSDGTIPIQTTKRVYWKGAFAEMLWFVSGSQNIKPLVDQNIHIWDAWAYKNYNSAVKKGIFLPELSQEDFISKIKELPSNDPFVVDYGDLGPIYGSQWRKWKAHDGTPEGRSIDQLKWAIWKTKNYPDRKHVCVSAWNPAYIYEMSKPGEEMALPPCHSFFQLNVTDGKLNLGLYQRSCDMFLGVPFNMAQYSLLTRMIAQSTGFQPGKFVHVLGDAHVYANHFEQMKTQLSREPKPFPKLIINPEKKSIDDFVISDFTLEGYDPHPALKGDVTPVGGFDEKDRGAYKQ